MERKRGKSEREKREGETHTNRDTSVYYKKNGVGREVRHPGRYLRSLVASCSWSLLVLLQAATGGAGGGGGG